MSQESLQSSGMRQLLEKSTLEIKKLRAQIKEFERVAAEPIAVIGIGCRYPGGGDSPEAFWHMLRNKRNVISEVPPDRWDIDALYDPDSSVKGKMCTRWGGFLKDLDLFEPRFFGISKREAASMDPQQRLLLEVSWEALENAGLPPDRLMGTQTGVFMGLCSNDYGKVAVFPKGVAHIDAWSGTGNVNSVATGRLSYVLGFQGPSFPVDTACSSSLVTVHLACQSLKSGESDLALAGGVSVILSPDSTVYFSRLQLMAPDGKCKTFDASANGYVRGEGCGVVVLRRLSDALADGDRILAVIRGSALNHDGRSNGLTAPNGPSQRAVIRAALQKAGIRPTEVGYVEAHGTGTALGDPIELQALGAVLGEGRSLDKPVIVGTVKTNIGHTEGAAGISGLIKAVLAVYHGLIPPNLHFNRPNSYIPWDQLPIRIPTELLPWPDYAGKRVAGVSSFGFSGTNAHVVLEEAPATATAPSPVERTAHILTLSALNDNALRDQASHFARHCIEHSEDPLADICFTANVGRTHFKRRMAVPFRSRDELQHHLDSYVAGAPSPVCIVSPVQKKSSRPDLAFLFSGEQTHFGAVGSELYLTQPVFRDAVDRCDALLTGSTDRPLKDLLFPVDSDSGPSTGLHPTARFSFAFALAELWRSWGITPSTVLGHDIGEFAAACFAGVFSLEDALHLICERTRLLTTLPPALESATILANPVRIASQLALHSSEVFLAEVNAPDEVVVTGHSAEIQALCRALEAQGVKTHAAAATPGSHSPLVETLLPAFAQAAKNITYSRPRIPVISLASGELAGDDIASPDYWCRQLRLPLKFLAGMTTLSKQGCDAWLEIGADQTLLARGRSCLAGKAGLWLPSLATGHPDWETMLSSLGKLHVHQVEVDWRAFDRPYARHKLTLPTYPFQRTRHWFVAEEVEADTASDASAEPTP